MKMNKSHLMLVTCVALTGLPMLAASSGGCGAENNDRRTFGDGGNTGSSGNAGGGGNGMSSGDLFDAGGGGNLGCVNLECQQVACEAGKTTRVTGVVYAPTLPQYGAADPLYNAVVYVPNSSVDPFPDGVSCDQCGAATSGDPVVITLSNAKGQFELTNVPAGQNIPLVIQLGRWRRQVVIPEVKACADTTLDADLTRLPRNKSEGDIPHIAIASSTYDVEECILRKIGIDDSEFTASSGNGRIHIYHGNGTTASGAEPMSALWSSIDTLKKYDMVLFPCSSVAQGDPAAMKNVFDYANLGGRVFATDLSYPWYTQGPDPFPATAQWTSWGGIGVDPLPAFVDQSFPKGKAMAEWLQNIGATQVLGSIDLHETFHVVDGVNGATTRWLYSTSPASVQTLSFNTPVGVDASMQCGRAVYSNFHIANGQSGGGTTFPQECDANPLTPQEKVLEFMLFDLASCVQDDKEDPIPPPN